MFTGFTPTFISNDSDCSLLNFKDSYYSYPTWIRAGCILNPTEVPLHADTYAVILLGQLKSWPRVIVIGLYLSRHTGVILKAALFSWKDSHVTCFVQEGDEQCETKTQHKRQADISSESQSVLGTFPTSWFLDLFIEKCNFVRFVFLTTVLLKIDVLWDIMACDLVNSYWCLQCQFLPLHCLTLKQKAVISFYPSCKWNQLGAQFFLICLLLFSTCFGQLCAHHQEKIPYLCDTWYLSLYIDDYGMQGGTSFRPAYQTVTYIEWQIPGVA